LTVVSRRKRLPSGFHAVDPTGPVTRAQLKLLERHHQQVVECRARRVVFGDLDERRAVVEADDCTAGSGRGGP
jgi:hypothetical protein